MNKTSSRVLGLYKAQGFDTPTKTLTQRQDETNFFFSQPSSAILLSGFPPP